MSFTPELVAELELLSLYNLASLGLDAAEHAQGLLIILNVAEAV